MNFCGDLDVLVKYAQILSPLLALLAIIVSWIIFVRQKERDRRERAIQIGLETEEIMHTIAYINKTLELESNKLLDVLHKADKSKMILFEWSEIEKVYSKNELKIIEKYFKESSVNQRRIGGPGVIIEISEENLKETRSIYYSLFEKTLDEMGEENRYDVLSHEFRQIVISTLNRLETLCLMMVRKVADEKSVYDTLQDKFIPFVSLLYYYIAYTNKDVKYGNKKLKYVIKIFNKWRMRTDNNKCKMAVFLSHVKKDI